ncbi:MAG: molecular chaperone DnaJ [Alphaproteobacteria bacterium]|nr:molecular chaperone DnaJ [Alphaproteobacteria bacterium]
MTWLALGAIALFLLFLLLRGFANAPVARVRQFGAVLLASIGAVLLLLGLFTARGQQALIALTFFLPLLLQWVQRWRTNKRFGGSAPQTGAANSVETAFLSMTLHHDSGRMTGSVKAGQFAGRDLATLTLSELLALLQECQLADVDSVALLEAWLDRAHPDWRAEPAAEPRSGAMTRAEALEILGLAEGADEDAIRAAHRRLMRSAHPDQGGSAWLAARINAARDFLLG